LLSENWPLLIRLSPGMGKDEKHFVVRVRDARFIDQPWRPVSDLGWTLFLADIVAAGLALFVLRPIIRKRIAGEA